MSWKAIHTIIMLSHVPLMILMFEGFRWFKHERWPKIFYIHRIALCLLIGFHIWFNQCPITMASDYARSQYDSDFVFDSRGWIQEIIFESTGIDLPAWPFRLCLFIIGGLAAWQLWIVQKNRKQPADISATETRL